MEVSNLFKSQNVFPSESTLKVKVDRKNLPSYQAMLSVMKAKMPFMYQKDVSHAEWHYAHYQKQCLKNVSKSIHFSKETIKPSALSYKDYDPKGLYDFSTILRQCKDEDIPKKLRKPRKLKPSRLPHLREPEIVPVQETFGNLPLFLEDCIWEAKLESTQAEPKLLVPIPPPPPLSPPSSDLPNIQAFPTKPPEKLEVSSKKRQSKFTVWDEPEQEKLGWEDTLLTKISKTTAQWIVNNQTSWGGWVQGKLKHFKKQKYDWNSIRYVLPCESDVELLDGILAEETVEGGPIHKDEQKKLETSLAAYYRLPSFHARVVGEDDLLFPNQTADKISMKHLRPATPVKRRERLHPRTGKCSYVTQNAFEQELYFGSAKIIHQKTKKDRIILDNHDEYNKHLEQCYPRPPEIWSFKSPKRTTKKVQKGMIHWKTLPTLIEDFSQVDEIQSPDPNEKERDPCTKQEESVSETVRIRKTMLEQWKAAWKFDPHWQTATIEGILVDLADLHVQNRINGLLVCASAVLERPCKVRNANQKSEIGLDASTKDIEIKDLPKKIQPLLQKTLFDTDAHVRMAAAVCFYAMWKPNPEAQSIMKKALIDGNSADSWAAAQALALEGVSSFQVVKRILSQIFDENNDASEEQACLLLARLSKHTGLVHCLLASELNSYQWIHRALACKTLSRIPGNVTQDLKNKIVQLMWTDWKIEVRQAAAKVLGHLKLGKEVHDQLRENLKRGDCRKKVEALSMIGWLKFMTARLLPGFLQCFSDDFVAVRKEACWAAGALQIREETVLRCLFKIMQTDPLWKIKALAIRALGQIGEASPYLKNLLLWALHYEEDPGVRREACRSIITLKMQDETVRATLLMRMILEPNEKVKEEVSRAVTNFNFEQEEEQEMIQKIKNEISRLSQKPLVIEKVLKLQEVIEKMWHEAHCIYREKGDIFAYRDIRDIFLNVVKTAFTDQTQTPSTKFSKLWIAILNVLPWLGIPPNPWTQRAFYEALKKHKAERKKHLKKPTTTEKHKESKDFKKGTGTPFAIHFET
ncbi:HEAT repeat-containing protein 4 isoform X1 [Pantherophis guttatus]|uniref:HEAT repeat-containing protein 4 isoform X1 n=1 Tax=Pantherophis guttatus TaxID=94885 RepID=A0A6P9C1M7_PANGU|nr:HEAT repeat-containing protein 4 isoform X1 [Pantherophis guttatus]XP_034273617.1 HEAT repeat-containing protein 4 isoform X1 [Pantherophis guttatus]XP_060543482.1 HEAT repeat-containing protein 4 isoform X1 [Pantherophis guttatus]